LKTYISRAIAAVWQRGTWPTAASTRTLYAILKRHFEQTI